MRKWFPEMTESLNKGLIFCIFAYWVFCFLVFPFVIPVIAYGVWDNLEITSWIELIYHVINGLVLAGILKQHLADAFLTVQISPKQIFRTVLIACGLMLLWVLTLGAPNRGFSLAMMLSGGGYDSSGFLLDIFPLAEMGVALTPGYFVQFQPALGTLCLSLLTPFAITGLFYATAFGPVCCNRPWLAYVVVSVVLLIPAVFDIFWRGDTVFVLLTYFISLPIHWFACWSYQKTDCIWTPIFSLCIFNLLFSLANLLLL